MGAAPQDNTKALANLLLAWKDKPEEPPFVLVLGAGASIRSGCPPLMIGARQIIEKYGTRECRSLSEEEQIEEFYNVMDGLDAQSLWLEIDRLFANAQPSQGYEYLARLVREGYFPIVFSTNVDTLMERALEKEGLSLISDVDVIDCGRVGTDSDAEPIIERLQNPTPQIKLVKLHGHLPTRQLKFRLSDVFQFPDKLSKGVTEYVSNRLRKVIIVGHSLRDVDLNNCLRAQGGAIWYVNPRYPTTSDFAGRVIANRPGSHHIGGEGGDFDHFFVEMFNRLHSTANRSPRSVDFLNRLNELSEIRRRLSQPGTPPVTVVSGPMGYGKTVLLRKAASELNGDQRDCALIECEALAKRDARAVLSVLASRFGCPDVVDWEQIGACLGQRVADKNSQYRAVLLIDGIDHLTASVRREVLMGLSTVYECVKEAKGECGVVLSGRYIEDDLDWMDKETANKGSVPFGQVGSWYSEIPLSEFVHNVIVDLIKQVARNRPFEIEEYNVMCRSLLEITGGHPKGLVEIVVEDLDQEKAWTFGRRPGKKNFYFTPENNERLFAKYMPDVVSEIKVKVGDQRWEDFQSVCILRRFNESILEDLINLGAIHQFAKGKDIKKWLIDHNLVRRRPPDMWGDAIARGVVVAEMKMVAGNRQRYGSLNKMAADCFSGSLGRLCQARKLTDTPELEGSIIAYGNELVYHRLETLKYIPHAQSLGDPLANVVEEAVSRLTPVGDEIVRRFLEETRKDDDVCPSREAKDRIASFLSRRCSTEGGKR